MTRHSGVRYVEMHLPLEFFCTAESSRDHCIIVGFRGSECCLDCLGCLVASGTDDAALNSAQDLLTLWAQLCRNGGTLLQDDQDRVAAVLTVIVSSLSRRSATTMRGFHATTIDFVRFIAGVFPPCDVGPLILQIFAEGTTSESLDALCDATEKIDVLEELIARDVPAVVQFISCVLSGCDSKTAELALGLTLRVVRIATQIRANSNQDDELMHRIVGLVLRSVREHKSSDEVVLNGIFFLEWLVAHCCTQRSLWLYFEDIESSVCSFLLHRNADIQIHASQLLIDSCTALNTPPRDAAGVIGFATEALRCATSATSRPLCRLLELLEGTTDFPPHLLAVLFDIAPIDAEAFAAAASLKIFQSLVARADLANVVGGVVSASRHVTRGCSLRLLYLITQRPKAETCAVDNTGLLLCSTIKNLLGDEGEMLLQLSRSCSELALGVTAYFASSFMESLHGVVVGIVRLWLQGQLDVETIPSKASLCRLLELSAGSCEAREDIVAYAANEGLGHRLWNLRDAGDAPFRLFLASLVRAEIPPLCFTHITSTTVFLVALANAKEFQAVCAALLFFYPSRSVDLDIITAKIRKCADTSGWVDRFALAFAHYCCVGYVPPLSRDCPYSPAQSQTFLRLFEIHHSILEASFVQSLADAPNCGSLFVELAAFAAITRGGDFLALLGPSLSRLSKETLVSVVVAVLRAADLEDHSTESGLYAIQALAQHFPGISTDVQRMLIATVTPMPVGDVAAHVETILACLAFDNDRLRVCDSMLCGWWASVVSGSWPSCPDRLHDALVNLARMLCERNREGNETSSRVGMVLRSSTMLRGHRLAAWALQLTLMAKGVDAPVVVPFEEALAHAAKGEWDMACFLAVLSSHIDSLGLLTHHLEQVLRLAVCHFSSYDATKVTLKCLANCSSLLAAPVGVALLLQLSRCSSRCVRKSLEWRLVQMIVAENPPWLSAWPNALRHVVEVACNQSACDVPRSLSWEQLADFILGTEVPEQKEQTSGDFRRVGAESQFFFSLITSD